MLIEGYIEFENSIPIAVDCLGKEFPIVIAGVEGILATPNMFKGFNGEEKLGPLEPPQIGEVKFIDEFHWGSVYSWPKGDSSIRACKILFQDISLESFEKTGNKIVLELEKWRSRLINNISYSMREDYRGTTRSKTISSFGIGKFELFKKNAGQNKRFIPVDQEIPSISIVISEFRGFDETTFSQVIKNTSKGIEPPLPFYFFLDAERAHFDENFRKSILDSATATEVCFSQIIGGLLPNTNDLNKYIYSKHNSLRHKRELLQALKVVLPETESNYINKLDILRNRVIHAGYTPSEAEVLSALKIAENTLYTLLPL
jgi:hypothetical protein